MDSLCIVQDDQADWATEAAQMSSIYLNSAVTVAAVSASHNEQGLFESRDPLATVPCWLFKDGKGDDYYVDGMEVGMAQMFRKDAPLYTRGWVLQERFLSRRILGYGKRSMTWDCREKMLSEMFIVQDSPIKTLDHSFMLENYKGRVFELRRLPRTPNTTRAIEQEALDVWNGVSTDYSRTQLSFTTDKLIAIQGIITVFEDITGWESLYGLWSPFFLNQLLWSPNERWSEPAHSTGVAPSWSWACSTGRIEYKNFTGIGFSGRKRVFEAELDIPKQPSQPHDGRSDITNFKLVIRTYLFRAEILAGHQGSAYGRGNSRVDVVRDKTRYEMGTLEPDQMDTPSPMFFLPLCLDEESMVTYLMGLCIKRSDAIDDIYQRCGMISFAIWGHCMPDLSLFSSGEERDKVILT